MTQWKADRTTIFASVALVAAGLGRMVFNHDFVLGGALTSLGIIIAARVFLYFRKLDAQKFTRKENSN